MKLNFYRLFGTVLVFCTALTLVGCVTFDIDEYYEEWMSDAEVGENGLLAVGEEPKIIRTSNMRDDLYELRASEYYQIKGNASVNWTYFDAEDIQEALIKMCKEHRAKVAIYSKTKTGTIKGSGGYSYTTSTGLTTYHANEDVDRYDYDVYFLVAIPQDVLDSYKVGWSYRDMDAEEREAAGRNTGAYINIVYNKFPAFYANLNRGDIIIKVGDTNINSSDDLVKVTQELASGVPVAVTFLRNGAEQTTEIIPR